MKYFKRGWFANPGKADDIIKKYEDYYKTIENHLSDNIKQVINHRHDTHIVKTYFENKNYIMELDEEIWGKAKFIFENADVKVTTKIEDEWWLYDEVYKVREKSEIHILFDKSEIIILCYDAHIEIEEREYFKKLREKRKKDGKKVITKEENIKSLMEIYNQATHFNEKERQEFLEMLLSEEITDTELDPIWDDEIVNTVTSKEHVSGVNLLRKWENLIYSFYNIYIHVKFYKNNNIEDILIRQYYNYSIKEKEEIYIKLFKNLEENIIKNINIVKKYNDIIGNRNLNYVIEQLQGVYNRKNMHIKEKNQLYLKLNERLMNIDFDSIYERILECINEDLIK